MKKVLIFLLIVLFSVLGYYCIFKSISIANINILSFAEITNKSQELDVNINKVKSLTQVNYPNKLSELQSTAKTLTKEKEQYDDLVKLSTAEEIILATQSEKYEVEYLWTIVGNHATDKGVIIKMEITTNSSEKSGMYDLNFTANGSYIAITDFIYSLENDSNLEFKIEEFSLLPATSSVASASTTESTTTNSVVNGLQAKFVVKNLSINMVNVSSPTTNETDTDSQDSFNTKGLKHILEETKTE